MSFILKIPSKTRLILGLSLTVLGILSLFILDNYDTGFLGGFLSGILLGTGIGLVITCKQKSN
ncbi:hypothetical protein [uncultured Olleya sp.]|uniref:hypothetical protein n=1 Tax=uncultured Olleya sp. TaxID=757243 RepID=UPI002594D0B0|nr:hypothetical protein [uncultured Olleya sp.]